MLFSKKKRRESKDEIVRKMQIPACAVEGCAHFELNGNKEVILDGSKGILEYDENIVKINTGEFTVVFMGRNLSIKCMTSESLIICGYIISIEFVR